MIHILKFVLLSTSIASLFIACDKDSSDSSNDAPSRDDYSGRGSEACQDWQFSMCVFMAETCGLTASERTLCETQYSSFSCLSDADATACVDLLESAESCDEALYFQCDWKTISDPQPAVDGCETLNEAQCARIVGCDSTATTESCMAEMTAELDCSLAVGLSESYEACLAAIGTMDCTDPAPEVCTAVVVSM